MASLSFSILISFMLCHLCYSAIGPTIEATHQSFGEYVIVNEKENKRIQISFEENYDADNQISSLWVTSNRKLSTPSLLLDYKKSSTSWIINSDSKTCSSYQSKESDFGFPLLEFGQGDKTYSIYHPCHFLILNDKNFRNSSTGTKMVNFRGIKANKFVYTYKSKKSPSDELALTTYWTNDDHSTTSSKKIVPLGVQIKQTVAGATIYHYVNYFLFLHEEFNRKRFMPQQGIACPNFPASVKPSFPEPKDFKTIGFKTEFAWKGNVTYVDTWLDVEQKILRVDSTWFSTIGDGRNLVQSKIMVADHDAVYIKVSNGYTKYLFNIFSMEDYVPEIILNPKEASWDVNMFFGTNNKDNNYVFTGKSDVGGLPCDIFQAVRSDWPPDKPAKSAETIWEWCIPSLNEKSKVKFPENIIPSFGLKIYVKSVTLPDINPLIEKGARLSYHFFDVRKYDSDYLTSSVFDISEHLPDSHKRELQFHVILTEETKKELKDIAISSSMDSLWKKAITKAVGIKLTALRITHLKTLIMRHGNAMVVYFTLLDHHPKLTEEQRLEEPGLLACLEKLNTTVNTKELKITWKSAASQTEFEMIAMPKTLKEHGTIPEGIPVVLHAMIVQQETIRSTGISASSLATICVGTLLAGFALGIGVLHKIRLAQRKSPM